MSHKKYIAEVDKDRYESVLNDWKWLINDKYKAIQITKFGDLILRHEDDSIFYLSKGIKQKARITVAMRPNRSISTAAETPRPKVAKMSMALCQRGIAREMDNPIPCIKKPKE